MKITVKIKDTSYEVEVGDINARPITATLEGTQYEVWPEGTPETTTIPVVTKSDIPAAPKAAAPAAAPVSPVADSGKSVVAPIPGVIISLSVKAGDQVNAGQEVCILEAMKMKNSIKASRTGKIGAIRVNPGDHVQHGQVLFEYDS